MLQNRATASSDGKSGAYSEADGRTLAYGLAQHRAGQFDAAVSVYRELLGKYAHDARISGLLGLTLLQLGENKEALRVLEPAIASGDQDAGLYNSFALALSSLARFREAAVAARRAASLKPDVAELQVNLGNVLRKSGDVQSAKFAYQKAIELKPDFASAHLGVGSVHASLGDRKAAARNYRRALELKPGYAKAFYQLALTAKVAEEVIDAATIEGFKRRLETGQVSVDDAILTHNALGFLADRAGDYDTAFGHFEAFNKLAEAKRRKQGKAFEPDAHDRFVDDIIAVFEKGFVKRWFDASSISRRPLFVLGMPRSGTTLVEQILGAHSSVATGGELQFLPQLVETITNYPDGLLNMSSTDLLLLGSEYSNWLSDLDGQADHVTDKLPLNFLHIGLIAVLFPQAKIVHCRRDPLDTCLSVYFQNFPTGITFSNDMNSVIRYYMAYERLMAHWRDVLPSPMIEIDYEALVSDPEPSIRGLIQSADLRWEDRCLDFANIDRAVHTASQLQVREPVSTSAIGRWKNYEKHLGPLIAAFETVAG